MSRRRKKKIYSTQNNSPAPSRESSKDVTPESSVEAARLSKKRRISFVETLPSTLLKSTEPPVDKSKKPTVGDFITISEPETSGALTVGPEQATTTEPTVEKKKKKKEKQAQRGSDVGKEHAVEDKDKVAFTKGKGKETTGSPVGLTIIAQPSDKPDDSSQFAKLKKRRRNSLAADVEDGQFAPKSSSKDPSSDLQAAEGEGERPPKKLKDKHTNQAASGSAPIPAQPSKSTKPKLKAQSETTEASDSAPVEPKNESTKRKKKDKGTADASKAAPPVPKTIETGPTTGKSSSKEAAEINGVKTFKKSKTTETSVSEAFPSENAETTDTTKKSKKSKRRPGAGDANDQSQPTETQPHVDGKYFFCTSLCGPLILCLAVDPEAQKSKEDKDETTAAAPADGSSTVYFYFAFSANLHILQPRPLRRAKRRILLLQRARLKVRSILYFEILADLKLFIVTIDNSLADDVQNPEVSKIDMKEATRLAVAAILSRKSAQAKTTDQPEALTVVAQAVPSILHPVAQNTNIQPQADESAQVLGTTAQEKLEPAPKCPICGDSPSHVRAKCPTIRAGIRMMRKRIAELQAEMSEDQEEERLKLISELQTYIDKRTKKPRTKEAAKLVSPPEPVPAAANKEVQETSGDITADPKAMPAAQPTANLKSSSARQPSANAKSTTTSKPQPTRLTSATQSPANLKSPPAIPPPVARSPLSQPSIRPPIPSQTSTSQKAPDVSQASDTFQAPVIISAGPLRPDFLGLGDVASYTDKDLEAIIRGPRMSVKDVPESDTEEEESEQEPEAALEEDDGLETKAQRNASRVEYPTSSDEDDEDASEEGPAASAIPKLETSSTSTPRSVQERTSSSSTEEMQVGDMSFRDVEANGSSRELDRTGNLAANDAVEADLTPLNPQGPEPSQPPQHGIELEADSDTVVASQTEGRVEEQEQEASIEKNPTAASPAEQSGLDPIEPSEHPPSSSQPEPIASDDDHPMQSTPKAQVSLRTRRQRGKAEPNGQSIEAQFTQPTPFDNTADAGEGPKSTKKGRSLVKISELPIPLNPSVRVIRPAPTPKTRRQAAQESQQERYDTDKVSEESNTRTTRSATAAKAAATKTPAKASKTPAKATTKTSAQTSTKSQSKTAATNGVSNTRTRSRTVTAADPDPEQPSQSSNTPPPESQGTVASWAVLQESGPSQTDIETPPIVDELLPSPVIVSTDGQGQKGQTAVAAEQSLPEPLFVPADSQQSFPYSQYPDLLHHKQATASPNESDDEEEVAAAVGRPRVSGRKNSMFRGLSEIASQPTLFVSRLSQQFTKAVKEPVENLYGRSGQDSEESDSGSDSEAEKKATASHIPASRRAGVSVAKKK